MLKNREKPEFGRRVIDIGLENVAVAAARVVELPPRYSNEGGKNVMFIRRLRETFCSSRPERKVRNP